MTKIQITPQDDPNALDAEIEIIAQYEHEKSREFKFLCFVEPGRTFSREGETYDYIGKCVKFAFERQGYTFGKVTILFPANERKWYIFVICHPPKTTK